MGPSFSRNLDLEALLVAGRWPGATTQTILALVGQLLAWRRDQDGFVYFQERARAQPDNALFLALEGLFQARLTGHQSLLHQLAWANEALAKLDRAVAQAPGLTTYFRGLVLADLPGMMRKAHAAVADLDWVLANKERFPIGLRRGAYRALAKAYTTLRQGEAAREALMRSGYPSLDPDLPQFSTDSTMTSADGYRFVPPRLVEMAPRVYAAQGYDFADMAFVLTDGGVVAVDATLTEAHARAALEALREVTTDPITHVIVTHAHPDHVGGLPALRGPDTCVIARSNYVDELRVVRATGTFLRSLGGAREPAQLQVDHEVTGQETLSLCGLEFALYPVAGGETVDGMLIHLPARRVVFTGDVIMPQLGAPWLPEGSFDGLLESMQLIRSLEPRLLIHGHTALTELFTIDVFEALETALVDLYDLILSSIREARTLADTLRLNHLPAVLESNPGAVLPFVSMRDDVIRRVYHQRTGYWQPDGEGVEQLAPAEWAAALDLLGGGKEEAFVKTARTLLGQSDVVLAHKLTELGLLRHSESRQLAELRQRALGRLRERYQALNAFKFIAYSDWADAELSPVS